jgi:hypothetical protein
MTIERSHGKPRPSLVRASDLTDIPSRTEAERSDGRDASGRAAPGNRLAEGRGWKSAIRKAVVGAGTSEEAERVARDAWTVYLAVLRDLAATGPLVRVNAAGMAREFAYAGFYDTKALEAGLATEQGTAYAARAGYHRQRAERLSVTVGDLARATSGRKATRTPVEAIRARLAANGGKS